MPKVFTECLWFREEIEDSSVWLFEKLEQNWIKKEFKTTVLEEQESSYLIFRRADAFDKMLQISRGRGCIWKLDLLDEFYKRFNKTSD